MPEATEDATFLIATSWQALGRARQGDERTETCDCTAVLVFAAFYIEANLNHLIEAMGDTDEMKQFFYPARHPGLQPKLAWFYNKHVAGGRAKTKDELQVSEFRKALLERFPGFEEIHQFRNEVSHGTIDRAVASLESAKRLRQQAKDIVADLFEMAARADHPIDRVTTYEMAVESVRNVADE
jgi:hypothetical protein